MTSDDEKLYATDGSDKLFILNPETLKVEEIIKVYESKGKSSHPQKNVNELEYVDGSIYANIWMSPEIVKINPKTGEIEK